MFSHHLTTEVSPISLVALLCCCVAVGYAETLKTGLPPYVDGCMHCCGATFSLDMSDVDAQAALSSSVQVGGKLRSLNFTVKQPRTMADPFVEYDPQADGLSGGPSFVGNFERSTTEGEQIVDIAVFPIGQMSCTVVLFSLSSGADEELNDGGRNRNNVDLWWSTLNVPAYQKKDLIPFVGCSKSHTNDTASLRLLNGPSTTSSKSGFSSDDGSETEISSDEDFSDVASCANSCCGVTSMFFNVTLQDFYQDMEATLYNNFSYILDDDGFVERSDGSYVAEAVFTLKAPESEWNVEIILKWLLRTTDIDVEVTAFGLCKNGNDRSRACVFDNGLIHQLHTELLQQVNQTESGYVYWTTLGCTLSLPSSVEPQKSTLNEGNLIGAVAAVCLLLLVAPWIKAASNRAAIFATIPARALYVIYFGVFLHLIDHHGGFGPQSYDDGSFTVSNATSISNHALIMSFGVLVLLTEGTWAATHFSSKVMHSVLQGLAAVFVMAGFGVAVSIRNQEIHAGLNVNHFTSAHSWVGLLVVTLIGFQFIFGVLSNSVKKAYRFRLFYGRFHRVFGFMTYFSGLIAVLTGLAHFGFYMARMNGGDCVENSVQSCFNKQFLVMSLLVWGMAITALIRAASSSDVNKSGLAVGTTTDV